MDEARRSFLKKVGYAAATAGCGFPLLAAAQSALKSGHPAAMPAADGTTQWGMVVDVEKCLRPKVREACQTACHRAHNVPQIDDPEEEVKWIWTENYSNAFPDQNHQYAKDMPVLVLCNHCAKPPCVKVCPTQATWRREDDGIVMMDMHRCIGCRYCIAACPYGSRSFNWLDPRSFLSGPVTSSFPTRTIGVVEKCNFCAERLRDNQEPACVEAAREVDGGEGALTFGNLRDPDSEVRRLLEEKYTICRRPSIGTRPNVFYIV
jgi:molybdopterin-containing oxidoreductase family iron-sulfur binding subunit